jgi:hypothetical protein
MRSRVASIFLACVGLAVFACSDYGTNVAFFTIDGQEISRDEQRTIERIARGAVAEVRKLLPTLGAELTVRVQPGTEVIPETGENASTIPPDTIVWTVDPNHPSGVDHIARSWLRASLFHELHHLVRDPALGRRSMLDVAVSEGMAAAFERDFAGVYVPWGDYPADVSTWIEQLRALPNTADRKPWMFRHPDGRRWIASKSGAYLVDRATQTSGKSSADLVLTPTAAVIELGEGQ